MLRLTSFFLLGCFTLWIIPLGAYIKTVDEHKVCGGKRAICLCTHLIAKHQAKHSGKTFYKGSGGVPV